MVADLLSILSLIRSLAKHALVRDDTHSKVVYSHAVILTAHNFWSHVSRSSRGIFSIFWVPDTCNSKVSYSEVAVFIKDQVFRLNVSV